ncbi:hypothetical protein GCM10023321_80950 [Pseudonocardia eucalypti]|uniref:Uncharacterized protein n=1 Tax=Pseudonocardia eucalypti TaxID=648755 RepID=A0ABP9RDW7_9PSEU|nr:hypothetical protein [Pseudonocardia eucalypti]
MVRPSDPTYLEYLENPEAEEGVIGCLLDRREQVAWLLENHVPRDSGAWCSDGLCLRLWPCVWWERAAEA